MYLYHKGDFESMRKDASDFAKDRYFNGYSDNRSVQENVPVACSCCPYLYFGSSIM